MVRALVVSLEMHNADYRDSTESEEEGHEGVEDGYPSTADNVQHAAAESSGLDCARRCRGCVCSVRAVVPQLDDGREAGSSYRLYPGGHAWSCDSYEQLSDLSIEARMIETPRYMMNPAPRPAFSIVLQKEGRSSVPCDPARCPP